MADKNDKIYRDIHTRTFNESKADSTALGDRLKNVVNKVVDKVKKLLGK